MKDTLLDKIKYKYWSIVPYEWRPGQLWYKFKCWAWKRHTTIKPRYLPHTWIDRCDILPHVMFEVLSQFIEQECSPGIVDWDWDGEHKIVSGKPWSPELQDSPDAVNVRKEMQFLYDWWHQKYNKEYQKKEEELWDHISSLHIKSDDEWVDTGHGTMRYEPKYSVSIEEANRLSKEALDFENSVDVELEQMMVRLIHLRRMLWT
jgi:hypothetical protein